MLRWLTIALALVALVGVGAGCGGDDEAGEDPGITVVTDETTDDTDTDADTDTDVSGGLLSGDCLELVNASAALGLALSGTAGDDLDDAGTFFDEFADRAPDEIRADYQVLADAYRAYLDAFADIQLEEGQVPSAEQLQALQQALASVDAEAVSAASQRISVWAQASCPTG